MSLFDPNDYPRDLAGYGRSPPDPRWPGGARVAVQFVINFEEGGENAIFHGDKASEAFLTDVLGAAALARPAPHERGIDVRIRLARRLLAAVAAVLGAQSGGDRLRRCRRARAQSRDRRRHARGRVGDRLPWAQMDRVQGFLGSRRSRPYARGDPAAHRRDRRAPLRLVYRAHVRAHAQARARRRRLSLFFGFLCRRSALLGARAERPASDYSLHARHQRHALHRHAGFCKSAISSSPICATPSTFSTAKANTRRR